MSRPDDGAPRGPAAADGPAEPAGVPGWLERLLGAAADSRGMDRGRLDLGRFAPPAEGGRAAAILLLFGDGPVGPDVLMIERAETLRSHAGQPAFPGGGVEPGDAGPADTALREAAEEVGLDPAGVRVVALLPDLYLAITDYVITPVIGWWHTRSPVRVAAPDEVARVVSVPIADLVDAANRCQMRHPSGYVGPAFTVCGMTVWGFTAGLLDRVLELAGWARPWDASDVRDLPRRTVDLAERGHRHPPGPPAAGPDRPADPVAPYEPDPSGDPVPGPGPAGGRTGPPGTVSG
jgi:8-oxo-dGTP pyrophosphatase MutT (NUDIX family)